ncbi:hypothetical protein GCM10010347_64850 [Streptomyces cirratus]|uniref:Secreted protein n=1 Tax=Streptomyces cirratus TaxID=68187 RepID=A0ABQ3F5D1_9ACTN|nr:hypothetical protein [Streptomyces cirratus]GHB84953.1 hypothetical protein GCM10010347_64850 [Streptomyces cirratus]
MKGITQKALALAAIATTAVAVGVVPASHAQARARQPISPEIGVQFNPDGVPGQCGGRTGEQWKPEGIATDPIRFDTDSRPGGCLLAFGIYDPGNDLAGEHITYTFRATPGADHGQCGNEGVHEMPIQRQSRGFGPVIRIDTDNRPGGCDLTFDLTSSAHTTSLYVDYGSDGDRAQCGNALPFPGGFSPVDNARSVTARIDTDDRPGGCGLQLRLG